MPIGESIMALIITSALAALFKSAEVDAAKAATSSLSVVDALVAEGWTAADLDKPKAGEVIGSSYHNLHTAIVNARVARAGITSADPRSIPALFYLVADRKAETIVALWDTCRKANPKVLMTTGKAPKAKQSNPELQAIRTREHVAIGERIQFYRDALVKREGAALAEATKQAGMLAGKSEDQIAAEAKAEDEKKWEKQFVAAMTSWEKKFQGATDSRFVPLATLVAHCRKACEATLNPPKVEKPTTKRKAK
jgi:hypothetical protein